MKPIYQLPVEPHLRHHYRLAIQTLVITAAPPEQEAVLRALGTPPMLDEVKDFHTIGVTNEGAHLFQIGKLGDHIVAHVNLLNQGNAVLQPTIESARTLFPELKILLMPGMCFGLHAEGNPDNVPVPHGGQNFGDLLVATGILDTHRFLLNQHRVWTAKELWAAETPTNPHLVAYLYDVKVRAEHTTKCKIHMGTMLTVPEVVRESEPRALLHNTLGNWPDGSIYAIGGDMEGDALYGVQQYFVNNPAANNLYALVIKGISDWGVGKLPPGHPGRPAQEIARVLASNQSVKFLQFLLTDAMFAETCGLRAYRTHRGSGDSIIGQPSTPGRDMPGAAYAGIVRNAGNGYQSTDDCKHWVKQFVVKNPPLRHLVITGPGGRGKTYFARQIIADLQTAAGHSRVIWINCGSDESFVTQLISQLDRGNLIPDDLEGQFHRIIDDIQNSAGGTAQRAMFASGSELKTFLQSHIFGNANLPVYMVLDDLDRYQQDLKIPFGETASPVASFLGAFTVAGSALRTISTVRDEEIARLFRGLLMVSDEYFGITHDGLSPLKTPDIQKFFVDRHNVKTALATEPAMVEFCKLIPGEPLILMQIENAIDGKTADESVSFLQSIVKLCQEASAQGKDIAQELRDMLFSQQIRSISFPAQKVAEIAAILVDTRFVPLSNSVLHGRLSTMDALVRELYDAELNEQDLRAIKNELKTRHILRADDLDRGIYRFYYDANNEWLVTKGMPAERLVELHLRATNLFESNADSLHLPEYQAWHLMEAGQPEAAFDLLMRHSATLNAQYKRGHLLRLHQFLRIRLWKQVGSEWKYNLIRQEPRWYINQGKLAEILYYGFSLSNKAIEFDADNKKLQVQTQWEMVNNVLDHLGRFVNDPHLLRNNREMQGWIADTYSRSTLQRAVLVFEKEVPEEDPLYIRSATRDNEWLAGEAEQVLTLMNVSTANPKPIDPPFAAMAANFWGCFLNGWDHLPEAISAYRLSATMLEEYANDIASHNRQLPPDFEVGLMRDRLDIANNWSRSRFLSSGPTFALDGCGTGQANGMLTKYERFAELLDTTRDLTDSYVEYTYALIDAAYYYLALGQLAQMSAILDRAYRLEDDGIHILLSEGRTKNGLEGMVNPTVRAQDKPTKRAYDDWIEGYIDALEVALFFYRDVPAADVQVHAEVCSAAFRNCEIAFDGDHFGYKRDRYFMYANAALVEIWAEPSVDVKREKLVALIEKLQKEDVYNEPVCRDVMLYLSVITGLASKDTDSSAKAGYEKTVMRFPGLDHNPNLAEHSWRPPIILRGALQMVPVVRTPQPQELGFKAWPPPPPSSESQ